MKPYLLLIGLALICPSCEVKETTVNPPHKDTVIIAPSTEKKTKTESTIRSDGMTTEKKETTTEQK